MTPRTESCVGLIRSGEVAEGACLIGLHAVSTPCSVWVVGLVECGMNQMDYRQYEEDSWVHNEKQMPTGWRAPLNICSDILFILFQTFHAKTERYSNYYIRPTGSNESHMMITDLQEGKCTNQSRYVWTTVDSDNRFANTVYSNHDAIYKQKKKDVVVTLKVQEVCLKTAEISPTFPFYFGIKWSRILIWYQCRIVVEISLPVLLCKVLPT